MAACLFCISQQNTIPNESRQSTNQNNNGDERTQILNHDGMCPQLLYKVICQDQILMRNGQGLLIISGGSSTFPSAKHPRMIIIIIN